MLPAALRFGRGLEKRHWRPLLWLSFCNYVVVLALQFVGLKYTSAASASTIVGLEPLLMVFIGHFFFCDFARWYHWLCGLAAFAGVAFLIGGGGGEGGVSLLGCLLVFGGGIVFCATMRPTQRMVANFSGMLTASEPVFGTLLAVLVLGERVSALSWLGIALVIAATAVAVVAPKLLEKRQSA